MKQQFWIKFKVSPEILKTKWGKDNISILCQNSKSSPDEKTSCLTQKKKKKSELHRKSEVLYCVIF